MPNTARGGGISRKITSITDRKRSSRSSPTRVPPGKGVILHRRCQPPKAEVKRDFEYLLRLWENVRELTLRSTAPTLVYEEGSLIKRSIRDLYNKDIDEVTVAGDDAYREAKDFMRMLMPSHAKNVKPYKEPQPLFARSGIEAQLDAMFSPQGTPRSGGYIVSNQSEALVSIDVNSGGSTREHNIEDTALQTNPKPPRSRPPASPARPGRAHRHRLHRHGGEAEQPFGRAQAKRCAEDDRARIRSAASLTSASGNVAPAHPHRRPGVDHYCLPHLSGHRPRPRALLGRAPRAALARRHAPQGRHAQPHHPARAPASRSHPQPEARALSEIEQRWAHHHGRRR